MQERWLHKNFPEVLGTLNLFGIRIKVSWSLDLKGISGAHFV